MRSLNWIVLSGLWGSGSELYDILPRQYVAHQGLFWFADSLWHDIPIAEL